MSLPSSKMIFITGASRSGTTMLSRIFNQHSTVFSLNELHVFGDLIDVGSIMSVLTVDEQTVLARKILQRQIHGIWSADKPLDDELLLHNVTTALKATNGTVADVFEQSIMSVAASKEKISACEQTPRNIFYADSLLTAFEQAHIVHIVRDPRSVLASQKNKWRRKFLGGDSIPMLEVIRIWCNYHPITLSKLWVKANLKASGNSSHPRCHIIKFEDLLQNPEQTLSSLCHDMGIDFETEMLNIKHEGSSHQHNKQDIAGISGDTVNSWKKSLSNAEVFVSEKICKKLMNHYQYDFMPENKMSVIAMILLLLRFPIHIIGVIVFNFERALIQLKSILNKA